MPREPVKPIMVMMLRRVLLIAAGSALIVLLSAASMGTSATKAGRISAHLTSTSFPPAQAGKVKVVYRFSSKSTRFAYVLSRKNGTAWTTLRRVSKRGSFGVLTRSRSKVCSARSRW